MKVYRFENSDNEGPWHAECKTIWKKRWNNPDIHPSIHYDKVVNGVSISDKLRRRRQPREYHCGFSSIQQLINWFSLADRRGLLKEGFGVSVYTVRPCYVIVARRQCVFRITRANLAKRYTNHEEFEKFLVDQAAIKH